MKNILEVDGVILEFGNQKILQDVYLKCETGKITGLLGRNGTGKTSLMNIIFGNIKLADSSVRINGKAFLKSYRYPESLMYLPQFSFIPKHMKVNRIVNDFQLAFSDFVSFSPHFEHYYNAKISNLSGGEIRLLGIYCILASKKKFCMLDEPFSQVIPLHIDSIKQLIIREKENKGILLTDHMYQHVIEISNDLYVIKDRKVYLTNAPSAIQRLSYIH
jgi:ABC-type multidrug transport system ATPase subunit